MRILARRSLVATAGAALILGLGCGDSPVEPAQTVDVFTPGNTFSPFSAVVFAGGVVRFNIFGDDHDVTFSEAAPGHPTNILVVKDTIVSRAFPTKGTFPYDCKVHPGMNGEVIVK